MSNEKRPTEEEETSIRGGVLTAGERALLDELDAARRDVRRLEELRKLDRAEVTMFRSQRNILTEQIDLVCGRGTADRWLEKYMRPEPPKEAEAGRPAGVQLPPSRELEIRDWLDRAQSGRGRDDREVKMIRDLCDGLAYVRELWLQLFEAAEAFIDEPCVVHEDGLTNAVACARESMP